MVHMCDARPLTRLPEDLELMPPGPQLCSLLATVDRTALSEKDRVRLLQARNRLSAHVQAELFDDLYAVSLDDEPDETAMRPESPTRYPWAASEVAFALTWTEAAAGARLELARQLVEDLPGVLVCLRAGSIDVPKALVICELASWLEDRSAARRVVEAVIDDAPGLTTGQLRARLRRLVLAVDPQAARRRCARALRSRRVESFPNPDGTGELWGRSLPPQDAAAAWERLTAIARAARAAGDDRTMDQLRADALLDLLVGEGVAVGGPVTRHLAGLPEADGRPFDDLPGGPPPSPFATSAPDRGGVDTDQRAHDLGAGTGQRAHCPDTGRSAHDWDPAWPVRPPDDLLRPDDLTSHPAAEPVDALDEAGTAYDGPDQWPSDWPGRWIHDPAVVAAGGGRDPLGREARVTVAPAPRRGVVELVLPVSTALGLDDLPGELAGWGPVLADMARQVAARQRDAQWRFSAYGKLGDLAHHGVVTARPGDPPRHRRRPTARVAAYVRARNRTCTAPGCRVPATSCDLDHTVDWARGGGTGADNLGPACRRHHRFKHESGATLWQLDPGGVFVWTTPRGMQYLTRPAAPLMDRRQLTGGPPCPPDSS